MNDFIEYLEEMVDFERVCDIKFAGDNGGAASIHTRLRELHISENNCYIKTADGLKISLSQIIEVNGRPAQNIC